MFLAMFMECKSSRVVKPRTDTRAARALIQYQEYIYDRNCTKGELCLGMDDKTHMLEVIEVY